MIALAVVVGVLLVALVVLPLLPVLLEIGLRIVPILLALWVFFTFCR